MDYDHLSENPDYYEEIGRDIWLMDDHRWAFYVWSRYLERSTSCQLSLVHADYHWDGVNDLLGNESVLAQLRRADLKQVFDLVQQNQLIRFDSFIVPAVVRGIFSDIHFFCLQDDGDDRGIDPQVLQESGCKQHIHDDFRQLSRHRYDHPVVFDLCLDLFNRSDIWYEGDIWLESEIDEFLRAVSPLVKQAALVTVSLSFGYSGTVEDTRRLARIVLPALYAYRR